jgi:hypothetical protein
MLFVTNGDILIKRPYDISCFLAVVRFPYEFRNSRKFGVGGEEAM